MVSSRIMTSSGFVGSADSRKHFTDKFPFTIRSKTSVKIFTPTLSAARALHFFLDTASSLMVTHLSRPHPFRPSFLALPSQQRLMAYHFLCILQHFDILDSFQHFDVLDLSVVFPRHRLSILRRVWPSREKPNPLKSPPFFLSRIAHFQFVIFLYSLLLLLASLFSDPRGRFHSASAVPSSMPFRLLRIRPQWIVAFFSSSFSWAKKRLPWIRCSARAFLACLLSTWQPLHLLSKLSAAFFSNCPWPCGYALSP